MPSLPTNAAFKSALESMTVTGVTVHLGYPPASIDTSDLPCAFLSLPSSGLGEYVLSCINEDKTRTMAYIIAIEASGQSTQETKYDLYATLLDNLESALDTALGTVANFHEYTLETGEIQIAGNSYWSIVATVTVRSV